MQHQLINFGPIVDQNVEDMMNTERLEKDINRRERALHAFLQGRKLTQQEIHLAIGPNPVY
jgi:hypothetical protein